MKIMYNRVHPTFTNCASLVADLFSFCYKTDFMTSLFRVIIKPI